MLDQLVLIWHGFTWKKFDRGCCKIWIEIEPGVEDDDVLEST